jgi:hypothetical protein
MAKNRSVNKTKTVAKKSVETLLHDDATRKNIPTAEFQSVMAKEHQSPVRVAYERRNRDLDPQLVWRGKDEQDWSDLVVQAPPLFIQEKVHPKVLIDDLLRRTKADTKAAEPPMDLFADFNGLPAGNAKTEFYQHDAKPYEDKKKVRVAGPFTVESLSPLRMLGVGADDELLDPAHPPTHSEDETDFARMILENLKTAGVQQAHKEDKISFTSITPWPGHFICAEGRYIEGEGQAGSEKRAGIFIGSEFGTVARQDLVAAAREAGDANFDALIACAFNYEAHATEFSKLGRIPVLKARMNADLHMADTLKNTGKGNLFVIFGEPDVEVVSGPWLVASGGRMVAHYDSVRELSGLGSLEEINRLGGADLSRFKRLSSRGEVRADQSDASRGGVSGGAGRGSFFSS